MSDCTCTNCVFMGDGKRYCYDCEQYTTVPTGEELERKIESSGRKQFATYTGHHGDDPEGHIYLDKEGACTITLTGAVSMSQNELDLYGNMMAKAISKQFRGEPVDEYYGSYENHLPRLIKEIEDRKNKRENKDEGEGDSYWIDIGGEG